MLELVETGEPPGVPGVRLPGLSPAARGRVAGAVSGRGAGGIRPRQRADGSGDRRSAIALGAAGGGAARASSFAGERGAAGDAVESCAGPESGDGGDGDVAPGGGVGTERGAAGRVADRGAGVGDRATAGGMAGAGNDRWLRGAGRRAGFSREGDDHGEHLRYVDRAWATERGAGGAGAGGGADDGARPAGTARRWVPAELRGDDRAGDARIRDEAAAGGVRPGAGRRWRGRR